MDSWRGQNALEKEKREKNEWWEGIRQKAKRKGYWKRKQIRRINGMKKNKLTKKKEKENKRRKKQVKNK